ncbi:uncharacterized protein BJ212DRAFT_1448253 [Suillus subaureus]|uniref:peptidylprolyl isomerase n=1 Tax=Suillus subaureus TaxID=48587 RepID=A0A9P7E5U6_9AGAM|nr:uncharacterized protein BJ212DRAFT_1448253 [Suillus subaureus]KAG1812162.1 hypothetical protein BJ212DRAFT_1448253 [Suillus subaureus]
MQFLKFWLSMLALAVCALAAEPPKELQIATGTLFSDGSKFDSSIDRGQPLPVKLGMGQVIKGWDEGLQGMCLNEKRTLTIPSDMAYGSRGFGNVIPAHSALVFDVELVSLQKASRSEL